MVPVDFFYRPTVGVMCGGSVNHEDLSRATGIAIAQAGFNLLTGGGAGAMTSVARAFMETGERAGSSLGIIPSGLEANPFVEIRIESPFVGSEFLDGRLTGRSRNHLNIRISDVIVALPGGPGTRSELALATLHRKPTLAFLGRQGLVDKVPRKAGRDGEWIEIEDQKVPVATTVEELTVFLRCSAPRWLDRLRP